MTKQMAAIASETDDRLATAARIAESATARTDGVITLDGFHDWLDDHARQHDMDVRIMPLEELAGWRTDPRTGNLVHERGGFFTVEGLAVHAAGKPVEPWTQPIISQPEIGILGIVVKELGGILHCLMQAKVEPGNKYGFQLSPTVQATRSNYRGVHGGKAVPYLDVFVDTTPHRILVDVRQSEQGAWFHHKRNRNMVVEVTGDIEVLPGFCWLTVGQVHELLRVDDVLSMDARTVLSCLPFAQRGLATALRDRTGAIRTGVVRSCDGDAGSVLSQEEILRWITDVRTRTEVSVGLVPLADLQFWRRVDGRIKHDSGLFFDVLGVSVTTSAREVSRWCQPMIAPHGTGVVAFLMREIDGVSHVLAHARPEPGFVDVIELAPTVQCTPENYDILPPAARPPFLDYVLSAEPDRILFDTKLSEEGGRCYHAVNRHLLVDTRNDHVPAHPDYRWVTLHQLTDLLRHSYYVNIQARTLIACAHSLLGMP